jgi:radical SAM superfamily enzyme YgiQ (UPF0313 family)
MPGVIIILGGPEVTYNPAYFPDCDIIIRGEGEEVFTRVIEAIDKDLKTIKGISYISDGKIIHNPNAPSPDLNTLKFSYENSNFGEFKNRILYYESSRGCPYSCAYCLESAGVQKLRFLALPRVYEELLLFLKSNAEQVKFIDRTFNADKDRANSIWEFLIKNDNGITNFHFEIAADLLDDSSFAILRKARRGLFQFEAGVQTTNEQSLKAINRKPVSEKILKNAAQIKEFGNIHIHLDLIAGLPLEGYNSFKNSFNETIKSAPDMLQLGFLKLLHGSALRENAESYGIKYRDTAPYEVLLTNEISAKQLFRLKNIERITDIYYNSGKYRAAVKYFTTCFETPFNFHETFADFWAEKRYFEVSHTRLKLYEILFEFAQNAGINQEIAADVLLYDILESALTPQLPKFCEREVSREIRTGFYSNTQVLSRHADTEKYEVRQIIRNSRLMVFNYDIISWLNGGELAFGENYVFFNYMRGGGVQKVTAQNMEAI